MSKSEISAKEESGTGWRRQFFLPEGGPYLLAHSVGCMPRTAKARLEDDFFEPWKTGGGDGWPQWLDAIGHFRSALSRLFGGQPEHWCPQPGVSAAISKIITGLDPASGRNVILISDQTFPSVGYALQGLSKLGFRVEMITDDPSLPSSWIRLGDPDVAVAVIMHVHSNSGLVSPVEELTSMARANDVFSIVDIAQSAGVLPLSVEMMGADAIVGTSVKWLSGGPGGCFAWLAPDAIERVSSIERGWFSHTDPFQLDIRRFEFAPDARRLWGGTPSVAPFVIATAGLLKIAEVGVLAIRRHNLALSARLLDRMDGALGDSRDLLSRGGTLCLELGESHEQALREQKVRFDRRGARLRLSFGAWNDEADVDCIADCLRPIARTRGSIS